MKRPSEAKFKLGRIMMTKGIAIEVEKDSLFAQFVEGCLKRHSSGDWGDLYKEDKAENEFSLDKFLRILSAYKFSDKMKIWIITEADRSSTTILFPEEY